MRIGFVPLLDAAPLIVAKEKGYFREEGLTVELLRQIGWANVRDKLTFGHLDASHALLGMPIISQMGRDWFAEPLVALMNLGAGGNGITVSHALYEQGVRGPEDLQRVSRSLHRQLIFGHVFNCSMHHYLLRDWLAGAKLNPDRDVRLCVIPPPQMVEHVSKGYLDGFCAGEPWNTVCDRQGAGVVVAATTDLVPNHPEKVLAVTQRWAREHPQTLLGLVRAVLRACAFCDDPAHVSELATLLSRREYIDQPVDLLLNSLTADRFQATVAGTRSAKPQGWRMIRFAPEFTFPNKMHTAWMLAQMIRWGHLSPGADIRELATRCGNTQPYRQAAESMGIPCPTEDFVPMPLRFGRVFDLPQPTDTSARPALALGATPPMSGKAALPPVTTLRKESPRHATL